MSKKKANPGALKKVLAYVGRYRILIALSMILAVVFALLSLYAPILAGNAIDYIIGPGNVNLSMVISILSQMAVVVLITALCQWVMNAINNRITFQVSRDVRDDAWQCYLEYLTVPDVHHWMQRYNFLGTDGKYYGDFL